MRRIQLALLCVTACLFYMNVGVVHASVPYAKDEWPEVSAILNDKSITADWRDAEGRSIALLELLYGSEDKAVAYIKQAKRVKVWREGRSDKGGRAGKSRRLLNAAVIKGSQQVVKTLLSLGETPNASRPEEESPLSLAAEYGHLEIMRMLIRAGANLDGDSLDSRHATTPINRALSSGEEFAFELLINSGLDIKKYVAREYQNSLVFSAISGDSPRLITTLSVYGFDMKGRRENGETPLTYAIQRVASYNLIAALVQNGADLCEKNEFNYLPGDLVDMDDYRQQERKATYDRMFVEDTERCKEKAAK